MTGYSAPNYTQIPNAMLDVDMRDMPESELKVTLAILRKIVGYHKDKPEAISYSQLEELTGLSRQGVTDGVRRAIERGRIKRLEERGPRGVSLFTVNFDDQSTQQTSPPNRLVPVYSVDTQKKSSKEKEKDSGGAGAAALPTDENMPADSDNTPSPSPVRQLQDALVDLWFNGNEKSYGRAGLLAQMCMGTSTRKGYQEYNISPPLSAQELQRFHADFRANTPAGFSLPTSPMIFQQQIYDWRQKARACVNPYQLPPEPAYDPIPPAIMPTPRFNADGTPIKYASVS